MRNSPSCVCCEPPEPCPCDCLLVKFTDLGPDCCAAAEAHRWLLTSTVALGCDCAWSDSESMCSPWVVSVSACLSGTTLEIILGISNNGIPESRVRWFWTGTVDADCTNWYNESLTFDRVETDGPGPFFPCGDPHPETGSLLVSAISCECDKCTVFQQDMTLRLRGQAEEVASTFGACCEAMFGDWVIPFTSNCTWEETFDNFCSTADLHIKIELVEDTTTTVKFIITVEVKDGATVLMQIVWESGGTDPIDCTLERDLGVFSSYTENDMAEIDCIEPCSGVGDNVLNPSGAQSGTAGVCT